MAGIASMFTGGPDIPEPPKPPAIPKPEDDAVEQAKNRVKLAAMQAQGRQKNIKTGSLGLSGPAPVATKMLLGD